MLIIQRQIMLHFKLLVILVLIITRRRSWSFAEYCKHFVPGMMYIRSASSPSTVLWAFHTIQPSSLETCVRKGCTSNNTVHDRQSPAHIGCCICWCYLNCHIILPGLTRFNWFTTYKEKKTAYYISLLLVVDAASSACNVIVAKLTYTLSYGVHTS